MAAPENGDSVTCTDERNFGSACTFTCATGFGLVGAVTVTCGGDGSSPVGSYDVESPACEGKIILSVIIDSIKGSSYFHIMLISPNNIIFVHTVYSN